MISRHTRWKLGMDTLPMSQTAVMPRFHRSFTSKPKDRGSTWPWPSIKPGTAYMPAASMILRAQTLPGMAPGSKRSPILGL